MSQEKRHPIEVVSRRTGLSKDLLRAWERRYNAVQPGRSAGGRRLYSDDNVERLLLLRRATGAGRRIKSVVDLAPDQLAALVREDDAAHEAARDPAPTNGAGTEARYLGASLEAIESLDAARLRSLLDRAATTLGTEAFAIGVATPLLRAVGEGWHEGNFSPRHEHLASAALRAVLMRLTGVGETASDAPSLVVATPAGQRHEFGALLIAAIGTTHGWRVTYLGTDLPVSDIVETAIVTDARAVALSVVYPDDDPELPGELRELRQALPPQTALLLGGRSAPAYATEIADLEARSLADLWEFRSALAELEAEDRR